LVVEFLYCSVNVCEAALSVMYVLVLAWVVGKGLLPPFVTALTTALLSLGAPASTETLIEPIVPFGPEILPVTITNTLVPVVSVTDGLVVAHAPVVL
jgi:hypothetical protein